ncbi:hypothetical protein U27_05556 [Candidatus Vecturithrix granuli]|uniref:Uncharacterized protein n=1 Tax=Vecturithrix granuli TaxID=1499967 RepID=A0A081C1X7_VECG1|nr:hypothetical protein U27_05556 [Candidatus Vecturithrix granuli]
MFISNMFHQDALSIDVSLVFSSWESLSRGLMNEYSSRDNIMYPLRKSIDQLVQRIVQEVHPYKDNIGLIYRTILQEGREVYAQRQS